MMFLDKKTILMLLVLASVFIGSVCCQDDADDDQGVDEDESDILGTLQEKGLTTFANIITSLGIVDELNGGGTLDFEWVGGPAGGPYTIFAPTNDAFGMIAETDLNDLLDDEGDLSTIIEHHIIDGTDLLAMGDVVDDDDRVDDNDRDDAWPREITIRTLEGGDLTLLVNEDGYVERVNGIDVDEPTDYGYGVVYEIDGLLLPDDEDLLDNYNLGDIDWTRDVDRDDDDESLPRQNAVRIVDDNDN